MNYRIILRILSFLLLFEAVFMLVPAGTALIYGESQGFYFLLAMGICAVVGGLGLLVKPKKQAMYAKEGFVVVALSWILMSIFGALPFYLSGSIPKYIDALFETVSGFTTTGASILSGEKIEAMPNCMLIWRSFTHWIGGMGVLVFIMAVLPMNGNRNMHLLSAESTGPSVSKLLPKMRSTAGVLYLLYTAFTILEMLFLVFDMSLFEAVNIAFSTAGTGGFGIKGDSLASYSAYTQVVVTVFMFLFAINFACYFFILCEKFLEAWNTEVKVFIGIVVTAIVLITMNVYLTADGYTFGETLRYTAFTVGTIISTTGFLTENYALWPAFSQTIIVLLMFVGGCAGSTAGGMKVSRMVILYKGATHEMKRRLHPHQIKKITMDKRIVEHEVVRGVNAYIVAFVILFVVSMLLLSLDCQDLLTNFTAVTTTLNNVGPGLGGIDPTGNFAIYNTMSKFVFMFNMLAGRLEIFPMLLLFAPATWHK